MASHILCVAESLTRAHTGKISAGLLIWIVRPEDGGLWTWSRRWPAAVDGMDDAKLEEFFIDMETQHRAVMGGDPHICKIPFQTIVFH